MKYVIIGGVAGGASFACRLRRLDENCQIVIYEKSNYQMLKNTKIILGNIFFNIMLLNNKDNIDEKEIANALNDFYLKTFKRYDKTLSFRVIEE